MKTLIDTFDVIAYLDEHHIPYSLSGKNTTSGWVEVKCPWCHDPSMHLGINLTTRLINCWVCGAKGSIKRLIQEWEGTSYIRKIIDQYQDKTYESLKRDILIRHERNGTHTVIPQECNDMFPLTYTDYLRKRNFDPNYIIKKYRLKAFPNHGQFKFRIFIPVYIDNVLVNFTAMDTSGIKDRQKYIHCKNENAIIPMKECVYNIDSVRDIAIICEGVADVWRVGDGAVATFGVNYSMSQVNLLIKKRIQKAYVLYDSDEAGKKKGQQLASDLSVFIPTEIIELEQGDPGDMSEEEVKKLRREVFYEKG
jgi:5S rRNA maturation endonuclease (ribonuclease M5)